MIGLFSSCIFLGGCGIENTGGGANTAPVADAGPDQATNVLVGDMVVLDGSASMDTDGDPLSYSWSLISVPSGSTAAISDPIAPDPNFVPDMAGEYVAQLTVNDGKDNSPPDEMSVTVLVPPPTVSISDPEDLSVVTATPLTVTGTVDDPTATITVNGIAVNNDNGSYTTMVALQEGNNTITVVGENGTGEGNASVKVILNTTNNPAVSIITPRDGFLASEEFEAGASFHPAQVDVFGVVKVNTFAILPANNRPAVTVNGVSANVLYQSFFGLCGLVFPNQCWAFFATVPLEIGNRTITATGTDQASPSRSTTVSIDGTVDYCRIGAKDPGVLALGDNDRDLQGNRCHEIDGCSLPVLGEKGNNPLPFAQHNVTSTKFGEGTVPPSEFFVHGLSSAFSYPCNRHDVCYQTSVPPGEHKGAFEACNAQQYEDMRAVCRKAYPDKCPYFIEVGGIKVPDPIKCFGVDVYGNVQTWSQKIAAEKNACFAAAWAYTQGVGSSAGRAAYDQRQEEYSP
jgi:hypothetical protein